MHGTDEAGCKQMQWLWLPGVHNCEQHDNAPFLGQNTLEKGTVMVTMPEIVADIDVQPTFLPNGKAIKGTR